MTESALAFTYNNYMAHLAFERGSGFADPTAGTEEETVCHDGVNQGYRQWIYCPVLPGESAPHIWSYLHGTATMEVGPDIALGLAEGTATVTGGTYDADNDETTLTASSGVFTSAMDGQYIQIDGDGTYEIDRVTSTTAVVVSGDRSGVSAATFAVGPYVISGVSYDDPSTTITISGSGLFGCFAGYNLTTLDDTNVAANFAITGVTSNTVVVVTGDASAYNGNLLYVTTTKDYDLPDDFGGIMSQLTFGESEAYDAVEIRTVHEVLQNRQYTSSAFRPAFAALRPKTFDGTLGQRWQLMVFPPPSSEYNLTYAYQKLVPDELDDTNLYPIGGAMHARSLLASILAVNELNQNGIHGPRWESFMRELATSVQMDRATMVPRVMPRNYQDVRSGRNVIERPVSQTPPTYTPQAPGG